MLLINTWTSLLFLALSTNSIVTSLTAGNCEPPSHVASKVDDFNEPVCLCPPNLSCTENGVSQCLPDRSGYVLTCSDCLCEQPMSAAAGTVHNKTTLPSPGLGIPLLIPTESDTSRQFNCETGPPSVVDPEPYGRGFAKAVHTAADAGQYYAVKQTAVHSASGLRIFKKSAIKESMWLKRLHGKGLHAQRWVYDYYGACTQGSAPFLVSEPGLVKIGYLIRTSADLHWCHRLQLSVGVLHILAELENRSLVHCDWKLDQLMVDRNNTVVLVDLDSLRLEAHAGHGHKRPCTSDADCSAQKLDCMKHDPPPDARCNMKTKRCFGFGISTLLQSTAALILPRILLLDDYGTKSTASQALPDNLLQLIKPVIAQAASSNIETRASLDDVLEAFHAAQVTAACNLSAYGALNRTYWARIENRALNCARRYC